MKQVVIKGLLVAAVIVFFYKGGVRILLMSWRIFIPLFILACLYFLIRAYWQKRGRR